MEDDNALIEKSVAGDAEALGILLERHQRRLYAFLYLMVRDVETAKDLTQESLIRAMRGIRGFRKEASFRTWLYQIGLNLGRRHFGRGRPPSLPSPAPPDRREPDALDSLIDRENRERVDRELQRLPERQRTAVILRVSEGLSVAETAAVMGCSEGAVKAHYHLAVKKLGALAGEDAP